MANSVVLLFLSLFVFANHYQAEKRNFKAIDLYGSSRITREQIEQRVGDKIREFTRLYSDGDDESARAKYKEIIPAIREMGKFAHVELSVVVYPPNNDFYITVDLVDEVDRASRMDFLPAPGGELSDPDNLLALWGEYESIGFDLLAKGALDFKNMKCPALHCIFGFDHAALKKFLQAFEEKIPPNKEKLIKILREDKDALDRGRAAYLLAHTKDAEELVRVLLPSINDQHSLVRNNVMRILGEVTAKRKNVEIPLDTILKALDYPSTTDRNKALYILDGLADRAENKPILTKKAGATLIKILRLLQPNNHDPAFSILKKISEKDFGERDYQSWERWISSQNQK